MTQESAAQAERDLAHGRAVIACEMDGLRALHDSLGGDFIRAVACIAGACLPDREGAAGRLIVSGMGKSGHIGRKIAATLASTGTPAYFVHPGEASHGDLGMIAPRDCLLLLSYSGETTELSDMVAYARRFGVPMVAIVGRADSTLAREANVTLLLPPVDEASPTRAPTTSTTMMLALGDALAVAMLERRGFTRDDFARYHPGGKLGRAFLKVRDLMHAGAELPLVVPDAAMQHVLIEMTAHRFGCVGVVENGALAGVITDGDLRRHMSADLLRCSAREVMTRTPVTIRPDALAAEALSLLNARSITSLFVAETEGGHARPVGILHIHDLLRAGVA